MRRRDALRRLFGGLTAALLGVAVKPEPTRMTFTKSPDTMALLVTGQPDPPAVTVLDVNMEPSAELLRLTMERELILAPGATVDDVARVMVDSLSPRTTLQIPAHGDDVMEITATGKLTFAPDVTPRRLARDIEAAWARLV